MRNMTKVKATCEHCEQEFELRGIEVDADLFGQRDVDNRFLSAMNFICSNCGESNTFTFDQLKPASE